MPGNNSGTAVQRSSDKFTIPQWRSWHFERTLKPDDRKVGGNFALVEAGEPDQVKVLQSYSHHPVEGYNIASIEIIYNEQLNRVFYGNLKMMNARYGNPKYCPRWKQEPDSSEKRHRERVQDRLSKLAAAHQDGEMAHVNILPLWHGTDDTTADYIFNMGYGIFTSNTAGIVTDPGFFGKGIYGAHEARYSFDAYAKKHGDQAVLLLNWVSSFEAYPVIDGDMAKLQGKMGGFDQSDAHFIPVRSDHHPHTDVYYPCKANQASQYTEMVVFTPVQFLPRYRVKLAKSTPQPSIDDVATMAYQMGLDYVGLHQYGMVVPSWDQANDAEYPVAYVRLHWWYSGASGVMAEDDGALSSLTEPASEVFGQLQARARLFGLNDAESQFLLGWCYEQGLCGVEKKPALAAQYYWVAASQNHRDALYHLGLCCSTGFGVAQNMSQAVNYYGLASQQNHVHAHYVLSQCYTLGLGVAPDAVKAATYRQQAQQGHHPALSVGFAPVPTPIPNPDPGLKQRITKLEQEVSYKDIKIAERDSKIAALRGDVKQKVTEISDLKQNIKQKDSEIGQLKQVAKQQSTKVKQLEKDVSQQQQQLQHQDSQVEQLKQRDKKQAAQVSQLESDLGRLEAEVAQAQTMNKKQSSELSATRQELSEQADQVKMLKQVLADKEEEVANLRRNRNQRRQQRLEVDEQSKALINDYQVTPPSPRAEELYQEAYQLDCKAKQHRGTVEEDEYYQKAYPLYQRAAEKGHVSAQANLVRFFQTGRGGATKNKRQALSFCEKAAEQGHVMAMHNLGTMYAMGDGVERDVVKAYGFFTAIQSHADASAEQKTAAQKMQEKIEWHAEKRGIALSS